MALKDIHVVDLEAFKASLDRVEDVLTNGGVGTDQTVDYLPEKLTLRERPWRLT